MVILLLWQNYFLPKNLRNFAKLFAKLHEYDEENRKYVIKNNFSEQSIKLMKEKLRKKDQLGFKLLLDQIEEQVKGEQQA